MAEILSSTEFTDVFTTASRAAPNEISWALDGGRDDLVDLVGENAVADAELESPTDKIRARRLKRPMGHLSYANLVLNVGSRLNESGVLTKNVDHNADNATVEYLKPREIKALEASHREKASATIQNYLLTTEDVETKDHIYTSSTVPISTEW